MSVFALIGKIFGAKKRDKPQPTGKAIQSLRETEEMVHAVWLYKDHPYKDQY